MCAALDALHAANAQAGEFSELILRPSALQAEFSNRQ
jgi:hypothetical protein